MAWKVRSNLRFLNRGLALRILDQSNFRVGQAFTINRGRPNQEPSIMRVVDNAFICNFNFLEEQIAIELFNSLVHPDIIAPGNLLVPTQDNYSWSDMHECFHDYNPPQICGPILMFWSDRAEP